MTLEPDPAAVLVHERLEQAVSSMRAPDVEAGWAALAAQLEAPIAPVVPLRTSTRGRFVAFAVAAALMVAGSAFAAVSHVRDTPADPIAPAVPPIHTSVTGPRAHAPFSGPPAEQRSSPHHDTQAERSTAGRRARVTGAVPRAPAGAGTAPPNPATIRTTGTRARATTGSTTITAAATTAPRARTRAPRAARPTPRLGSLSPFLGTFSRISRISRPVPSMGRVTTPGHPNPIPLGDGSWSPTLAPSPWTWLHRTGRPSGRLFRVSGLRRAPLDDREEPERGERQERPNGERDRPPGEPGAERRAALGRRGSTARPTLRDPPGVADLAGDARCRRSPSPSFVTRWKGTNAPGIAPRMSSAGSTVITSR